MGQSAITGINLGVPAFILPFTDGDLSAGVLTVNHNLNAQYLSVTVFNNSNQIVIPDQVTVTGANTCTIDLTSYGTLTGTYRAVVLDSGATMNSVASDLSLAGQTSGDRVVYNGSNWARKPACLFSARMSADQLNLAVGVNIIQFDTENFDIGGNFNTGTYTFTAPVDGYYLFNVKVDFTQVSSSITQIELILNMTGGNNTLTIHPADFVSVTTDFGMTFSYLKYLAATGTAYVSANIGGAATMDVYSDPNHSTFSGFLIA